MPTRRTITRSYRGLFGSRVRYTTTQTIGPQQPRVQVQLTGSELMEMQRQQALAAMSRQQAIEQVRQQEAAAQQRHLAALNDAARWLHTPLGAIVTLTVFLLGMGIVFTSSASSTDPTFAITGLSELIVIGLPITLAIIDWRNFSSFHGVIPWNVWRAEGKNGRWWTLAIVLALYGWLFMPAVYAIQAWQRAGEVKAVSRAALDAKIAALEAQVLPQPAVPPAPARVIPLPPVIPPPPPPLPIVRRYASDEEYTQGATSLVVDGWTVSKVSRDKDNAIVVNFTHSAATAPSTPAES